MAEWASQAGKHSASSLPCLVLLPWRPQLSAYLCRLVLARRVPQACSAPGWSWRGPSLAYLKNSILPQGSGISFFTMSTGMADTYRSAVIDSPLSRLYCLQQAQQRGAAAKQSTSNTDGCWRRLTSVSGSNRSRATPRGPARWVPRAPAPSLPSTAGAPHFTVPSSFSSMFFTPAFMRTSPPRAAGPAGQPDEAR